MTKRVETMEMIETAARLIDDKRILKRLLDTAWAYGTLDAHPNDDDTYYKLHIVEQVLKNNDVEQLRLIDEILKRFAA